MILEQAFHYLPEILLGTHYPQQDYEGGIVASYALAVLQELNGRNAPNPLSMLQCERPYRKKPKSWPHAANASKRRYLRSDLHVNLHPLGVGNEQMAGVGWRHSNWIEAKYYRALNKQTGLPKVNVNQPVHTGHLMADLYRLLALVPRSISKRHNKLELGERRVYSGRYLLHVYTGEIKQHLSLCYKGGEERPWLGAITQSGDWEVTGHSTGQEPRSVSEAVGIDLDDLELDFSCSTSVLEPFVHTTGVQYTCVLTRINSFRLNLDDEYWGIDEERYVECSDREDHKVLSRIAEFVGSRIGLKNDSEESSPVPMPDDIDEEDGDE